MANRLRRRLALSLYRSSTLLRVIVALMAVALAVLLVIVRDPGEDDLGGSAGVASVQIFLLVNGLISVVLVLAFLVARNLVKLFFDRKRGLLGSRLRLKLALSLVLLTLVPTALLFVVASGLINQSFDGLLSSHVEGAIDGSIEIARQFDAFNETRIEVDARALQELRTSDSPSELHERLERERSERKLYSVALYRLDGTLVSESRAVTTQLEDFAEPALDATMISAPPEPGVIRREREESNEFLRWYGRSELQGSTTALVITILMPPEVTHAKSVIVDWFKEYEQFKLFRGQLKSGTLLTLLLVTLLLVFAALWWGFYLARQITGPLMRVVEGTQNVARGNYDVVVRASGGDEIGILVNSFNRMTKDLRSSRLEGEGQRRFIEGVLAQLAVGVVGMTKDGHVTVINERAKSLLGISEPVEGRKLVDGVSAEVGSQLAGLIDALTIDESPVIERETVIRKAGQDRKVVLTAGLLALGGKVEVVLTADDVTELSQAQALFAWREVARRIAHEIKNPLTPIQLSAQRLERLVANTPLREQVGDVVQTIVNNVESIKRLTNEFSKFARMPTAQMASDDLNVLIEDVIKGYSGVHPDTAFQVELDRGVPQCMFDREQLRRVLVNLVENAVFAVNHDPGRAKDERPRITVRTGHDPRRQRVRVSVVDNGPGVPVEMRQRIFDPYVSFRSGGTGLGLSIVSSIITDHQGAVYYVDNTPRGAAFVFELPTNPRASGQAPHGRLQHGTNPPEE
jgi:two-component system nitrogen regulation sensor histidine kinase NtrY